MKIKVLGGVVATVLWCAGALAAPERPRPPAPPELTEQTIDAADFDGWRARDEARGTADADRKAAEEAVAKAKRKRDRKAAQQKLAALPKPDDAPDPFLIRAQILLDRAHASPGAIDGRYGDNMRRAVRAFREMRGLPAGDQLDAEAWAKLSEDQGKATQIYEITPEDEDGRYVGKPLPTDYAKLARMKWIGFRDAAEMLAERFHLDEGLMRRLNPGTDFDKAGSKILAPATGDGPPPDRRVLRILVNKGENELRALDKDGDLVFAAPATVGSGDTPSPSGTVKVTKPYLNPVYKYDPKKNFQQGKNKRKLTLKPGPNGPVGSMWIDLDKPTYGIHGTPEPSKIGKTESHGCVRLTNWDAETLGGLVEPNKTVVEFR
ncbi:L,D-transpeptidase family protein [Hansschlegelia sp.]|uniref:L,D-transpeptidase family protein n=1 Tax=Hansschlegelia sp. TaxID=2041892 RepID=UPI002C6F9E8B|nr:L,D-transpeptidase family protein [Hansschlegelia sp.]HVI30039.1 L,D-transpeptidase family protein [Hansschlegelia sp.]